MAFGELVARRLAAANVLDWLWGGEVGINVDDVVATGVSGLGCMIISMSSASLSAVGFVFFFGRCFHRRTVPLVPKA